jgi:hypothetical protein
MDQLFKLIKSFYLRLTLSKLEYKRLLSLEDDLAKYTREQRKIRRKQIKSNRNFQKNNSRKGVSEELRTYWKYRAREKKAEAFKIFYTRWYGDELHVRNWSK